MKAIKLKIVLPIDDRIHESGDVVMVPDVRAAELVRLGHAEEATDDDIANPDHNQLADCIDPEPDGGLIINPIDASAPNVRDHPGLAKAVEIGAIRARNRKLAPDQVVQGEPDETVEANTEPSTTAAEVTPAPGRKRKPE